MSVKYKTVNLIAVNHIYAQVFGIINRPTFGFVLLNKVTGI